MSLKNKIYYNLPLSTDRTCPKCKESVTSAIEAFVLVNSIESCTYYFIKTEVPYCTNCSLPCATRLFMNRLRYTKKAAPFVFETNNAAEIVDSINRLPKELQTAYAQAKQCGLPVIEECWQPNYSDTTIVYNRQVYYECPACGGRLANRSLLIPYSISHQIVIEGYKCVSCKYFFTSVNKNILVRLFNHTHMQNCRFDINSYYDETNMELRRKKREEVEQRNRILAEERARKEAEKERVKATRRDECTKYVQNHPSTVVILYTLFDDEEKRIVITSKEQTDQEPFVDSDSLVLFYKSDLAREILSATYVPQRKGHGAINGHTISVQMKYELTEDQYKGERKIILDSHSIAIQKGGGYHSSADERTGCYLADLLLYSPFTQRLEIMRSTYDKQRKIYYTDAGLFRDYIEMYGKPDIDIHFRDSKNESRSTYWEELNPESILKIYGYSVSRYDDYADVYRQKLLAELVDLQLLRIDKICSLLEFFIRTHPGDKDEEARAKWQQDLTFIKNYKYNPQRFLIAVK